MNWLNIPHMAYMMLATLRGYLVRISATVRKFRTVSKEGNRMITRNMDYSAITLMGTSPEVILSKVE